MPRSKPVKISEYMERKITAEDRLNRVDIRSPQNGYVHQLAVHGVGAVIGPGELIMLIVPDADALVVDAKISPRDIDKVRPGQSTLLRFTAFDLRTTPELQGEVYRVSPDLISDPTTGLSYYSARIHLSPSGAGQSQLQLLPGMPVEAFIQSGDRTVLSYLFKPLGDHFLRAFRES